MKIRKYRAVFQNKNVLKHSNCYVSLVSLMDAMRRNWSIVYALLNEGYTVSYEIVDEEA